MVKRIQKLLKKMGAWCREREYRIIAYGSLERKKTK